MANYPNMRLYQNTDTYSPVPLSESNNTGWLAPKDMGEKFSAMCWFFGRNLYAALEKEGKLRPIGLVATHVGGTRIGCWSSPTALQHCDDIRHNPPWNRHQEACDSTLWNGKVVPLLRNAIKGAVWMQGESNVHSDGRQYECLLSSMVEDWRSQWSEGTENATDRAFPFGWGQLNSNGPAIVYNTTSPAVPAIQDPEGKWNPGFTSIRLAEASVAEDPRTFMAVLLDTPVASGWIHSPFKQPAGDRLTRGALSVAYGIDQPSISAGDALLSTDKTEVLIPMVGLAGHDANVTLRGSKTFGFEVLCGGEGNKTWHLINITKFDPKSVTIGTMPGNGNGNCTAVRYLWYEAPCGDNRKRFNCPVYAAVPSLGSLSGQYSFLPLGPFIRNLTGS